MYLRFSLQGVLDKLVNLRYLSLVGCNLNSLKGFPALKYLHKVGFCAFHYLVLYFKSVTIR